MFYTLGAAVTAFFLSILLSPPAGTLLEKMFWFYSAHFVIWPVLLAIPIFALLGSLIPSLMYRQTTKQSIVERLRET